MQQPKYIFGTEVQVMSHGYRSNQANSKFTVKKIRYSDVYETYFYGAGLKDGYEYKEEALELPLSKEEKIKQELSERVL